MSNPAGTSMLDAAPPAACPAVRSDAGRLRMLVIAAGLCWSVLFVVVGLSFELQTFGDASMFAYAVAVRDAWAFHWHNIPDRLFAYLVSTLPAEIYVGLAADPRGGIVVYGVLQFVAPLLGLAATWMADRSPHRLIFVAACFSTAALCPLVFGFPTEMWMAHSLFWPALAVCHYARGGIGGWVLVFSLLLALVFTHEGALVFALAILATLLLRGIRDAALLRGSVGLLAALSIWLLVRLNFPPGDYYAPVVARAALTFIDPGNLASEVFLLLFATLAGYAVAILLLRGVTPRAHVHAAALVVVALAVYWLRFDHALHAVQRYEARTALLVATPLFGAAAALHALAAEGRLKLPVPFLPQLMAAARTVTPRAAAGALALVLLVHAVETAKFVAAWSGYRAVVRGLATGTASDPALGDAHFVSSARIGAALNRLAWFSTTQYLSVLVTPDLAPRRLVIDPHNTYFWLSCATATANERARRAVPVETRRLVRVDACLHR